VVNGTGRISPATAARVRAAAQDLGWTPHAAASALRNSRARALALVVARPPDLLGADPHFTALISGMEAELAPRGYGLLLQFIGGTALAEEHVYRRLAHERRVDGVFLTDARVHDPRFALVQELNVPYVLIGTPPEQAEVALPVRHVSVPGPTEGVRAAVELLLGLGHRRIAYVTGPADRAHTVLRRRVVEQVLTEHGLTLSHVLTTDFTPQAAADSTDRLLDSAHPPTAVLYANDSMALSGMGAAQRRGLRVPEDLSVIGYDDLAVSRWVHPGLTTVNHHVPQVGAAAAIALLAAVGEDVDALTLADAPRLVVRGSTAPPR
jgi:DNA-binding LacI/PurR family transcriptional regulator